VHNEELKKFGLYPRFFLLQYQIIVFISVYVYAMQKESQYNYHSHKEESGSPKEIIFNSQQKNIAAHT
jgi:hypothetical protein